MNILDEYAVVQPAIRIPEDLKDLRVSIQIEVVKALRMARYEADRCEPHCYNSLDTVWAFARCGLINRAQVSAWHEEIRERFMTALIRDPATPPAARITPEQEPTP